MYSLMNGGDNFFCHLMAEQVLTEVMEQSHDQQKEGLLEETISSSIIKCILDESLRNVRIFLETTGILHFESAVLDTLLDVTGILLENENEIFFLGCSEDIKEILKNSFQTRGYEIREQYSQSGFWFLEIGLQQIQNELSGERCSEIIHAIHDDNLRILVADGPKGKTLDMKRLLEDGEDCVYYYCYRLAQRMVEEELVFANPVNNRRICLVAGNDMGYYVVRELCKILGTIGYTEKNIAVKPGEIDKFIIVRDVIHMFCELNRLASLIEGEGGLVGGSACLIDINTGVGSRKNRASLFTFDLEKGISYRLRHKKREDKNGF